MHRSSARAGARRPLALPWLVALGLACAPEPVERVERPDFAPPARTGPVSRQDQTRLAATGSPPFDRRICGAGADGFVEVGIASGGAPVRVALRSPGADPVEGVAGAAWTDLRAPAPDDASDCVALAVRGPSGARVAVSRPLHVVPGRPRPWVLLYVVDTLRFDTTPFGGGDPEQAPAWTAFARDAVLYTRALATTSWTRPAVATLLTGAYSSGHHVFDFQDRLPPRVWRLPETLAQSGWQTVAVSSNANILPLWGFLPGFDRFLDAGGLEWMTQEEFTGLRERLEPLLDELDDRPLFLYVHDNEPHVPYRPPPRYRELFGTPPPGDSAEVPDDPEDAEELARARALYRAEVRSASDRFGELMDRLRELGRYDDALVVLVGDHGEEFGERGRLFHGMTLYSEQVHVPLLVKYPAGASGTVRTPVSFVDVVPTVLDALGLEAPADLPGRPLPRGGDGAAEAAERTLFAELALEESRVETATRWPWRYVREPGNPPRERLFHLEEDPQERADRIASHPEVAARLREELDRLRAGTQQGLAVACAAGREPAAARLALRWSGGRAGLLTALGLEAGESLRRNGDGAIFEVYLRPAEELPPGALHPMGASRAQPDREQMRAEMDALESLRVALEPLGGLPLPRLEGPAGEPLPADVPLPAEALTAPGGILPPLGGGERPVCRIAFVPSAREQVADEEIGEDVRQRLRDLGYIDEEE